jgi:hypothetical protein
MVVLCVHRLDTQFHFIKDELKEQSILYTHTTPLSEKLWYKIKTEIATISQEKAASNTKKNEQE